jgi:hypothetical protein
VAVCGTVKVNDQEVGPCDGLAAFAEPILQISAADETEVVLVDAGPAPSKG